MEKNTLFPGRLDYTGPTKGWFGFIHHEVLFEYSHNIMKRISYIKQNKPKNEIPTRLNHLISLAAISSLLDSLKSKRDALDQEYRSKRDALDQKFQSKRDALYQEYWSKWTALYQEHQSKRDALYQVYRSKWATLDQEHQPKWATLDQEHQSKRAALYQEYRSKRDALDQEHQLTVLNYIKQHIPDCAWNGNQLQFPAAA